MQALTNWVKGLFWFSCPIVFLTSLKKSFTKFSDMTSLSRNQGIQWNKFFNWDPEMRERVDWRFTLDLPPPNCPSLVPPLSPQPAGLSEYLVYLQCSEGKRALSGPWVVVVVVLSPSHVTPWTAAHQASLSLTISRSLPKFMFIASVMGCSTVCLFFFLIL